VISAETPIAVQAGYGVYINTSRIQKVLAQPHWQGKFTPRDYAALTPLIWEHVNPCGGDINKRIFTYAEHRQAIDFSAVAGGAISA